MYVTRFVFMPIVTIDNIPVYDAVIEDDECGMLRISLVDDPAVMSNFLAFDKEKKMLMYAIEDEEQRKVLGVVMRADFPIYRRDKERGEYYIMYKADTIAQMAEKYLLESRQNDVNLDHDDDKVVDGVQMVQCFIKDTAKGINPEGFDEIADGSLFAEFHVVNDDVWQEIKDGTYKGFSLEGIFALAPEEDADEVQTIVDSLDGKFRRLFKHSKSKNMSKVTKFLKALESALVSVACGTATTDKGVIAWDGDEDLKEGDAVFIEDAEGNRTPAEDGDYTTDDGKVIKVTDGKVESITDAESEVAGGKVSTDNGELVWDGEEDLKEGDEVFVEDADGNRTAAPDGDYKTKDGKTIKVVDGKVAEIVDPDAEVAEDPANVNAKKMSKFAKIRQAFEDSYEEKERKIMEAISALLAEGEYACLVEAGDNYAVVNSYSEENWEGKYIKYEVTFDEEGNVTLGASEEVKKAFVPVDTPNPADPAEEAPTAEEMSSLKNTITELRKQIERLEKNPSTAPAHEQFKKTAAVTKTGDRGLDNFARIIKAGK